jgi:hypothetical protein
MSSVNVTQLIEKEKLTDSPTGFWRKEDDREQIPNDPVYNNCLTETGSDEGTGNDVLSVDLECQARADNVRNTWEDVEEDSDETRLAPEHQQKIVEIDIDETDYFDSDDEYWETRKDEGFEEEYSDYPYHPTQTNKDGRYSKISVF